MTGLGWHISEREGRTIHWHNGGTGGFSAMLALDRLAGCAVGALATASPTCLLPLDGAVLAALTAITAAAGGAARPDGPAACVTLPTTPSAPIRGRGLTQALTRLRCKRRRRSGSKSRTATRVHG